MGMHSVWRLKNIAQVAKGWQENKFDGIIVFDGRRGCGKSTGAINLAYNINTLYKKESGKSIFSMKNDIVFKREDVMKKLAKKKRGIIIADEMINVLHNREFFNQTQIMLIKMLNMYRDNFNILISCVPNFYDLDKQFRNLCKMRINVVRRGFAVVHTPNQTSYSSDNWDLKTNEKIERRWVEKKVFKPNYKKLTTFRSYLKYPALTPKREEIYLRIKEEKRNQVYEEETGNKEEKIRGGVDYENLIVMVKDGRVSKEDLIKYCGLTHINWNSLTHKITKMLKDRGENITFGDLLSKKKFPITTFRKPKVQIAEKLY